MGVLSDNPIAFVQGEVKGKHLVTALSDAITGAVIPKEQNHWKNVFYQEPMKWATYTPVLTPNTQAKITYKGKEYNVQKMKDITKMITLMPDSGTGLNNQAYGYDQGTNSFKDIKLIARGKFEFFTSVSDVRLIPQKDELFILVADQDDPTIVTTVMVEHTRDSNWNEYRVVMDNGKELIKPTPPPSYSFPSGYSSYDGTYGSTIVKDTFYELYKISSRSFVCDPIHSFPSTVVLRCGNTSESNKDSDVALENDDATFVVLQQLVDDYNYVDVRYGLGFKGTNSTGDPSFTLEALDPTTVETGSVAKIIDQKKADDIYSAFNGSTPPFTEPSMKFKIDPYSKLELISPKYHWFYARSNTEPWMPFKKRYPDWEVSYSISMNNDHLAMVIQGDPSPDFQGYYTSFAYIGKIIPFNDTDTDYRNFAVTVGMGELDPAKTTFNKDSVDVTKNPDIALFGKLASNGVTSFSMMGTRSFVPFQSYYPALVTQMPDFTNQSPTPKGWVPTFPAQATPSGTATTTTYGVPKFLIDAGIADTFAYPKDGFQASVWTKHFHGSPIYVAHLFEGFRGWLDGVVAVDKANLITDDELVVETDERDGQGNPIKEIYKYFTLNTPVSFLKRSANPITMTIAIRKQ